MFKKKSVIICVATVVMAALLTVLILSLGKPKDDISVKVVNVSDVQNILSGEIKTPGFVEGFEAAMDIYFAD